MTTFDAVGDPSLSETIGRRLMTPGGAVAPGVAPELFPCVVLENDRPEWHYLGGGGIFGRSSSAGVAAGGAGVRSSVQIVNARRDNLVIVESIEMATAATALVASVIRYGVDVLPFGTAVSGVPRDSRMFGRGSSATVVIDNTLAAAAGSTIYNTLTPMKLPLPVVLAPGDALYCAPVADNTAITIWAFGWRERKLNPSER